MSRFDKRILFSANPAVTRIEVRSSGEDHFCITFRGRGVPSGRVRVDATWRGAMLGVENQVFMRAMRGGN